MLPRAIASFRRHAATVETGSPFDRRSLAAYSMIASLALTSLLFLTVYGFKIDPKLRVFFSATVPLLLLGAYLARRIGLKRIAGWLETVGLTALSGAAAIIVLCALTVLSGPYADGTLARADAALGFHWLSAARWLADKPLLADIAVAAYGSFAWQPALILGVLFFSNQQCRGWRLLTAALVALLICIIVYPFAPADGPFFRSGLDAEEFGRLGTLGSWQSGEIIHSVKDRGSRLIDNSLRGGLISIPSYHAAGAVIFAWAMWRNMMRWLFILLNIGVAAATVVVGNHYLVDVLAGLTLGFASIVFAKKLISV